MNVFKLSVLATVVFTTLPLCALEKTDLTSDLILARISQDSPFPKDNYRRYSRKLVKTLMMLDEDQIRRVFNPPAGTQLTNGGLSGSSSFAGGVTAGGSGGAGASGGSGMVGASGIGGSGASGGSATASGSGGGSATGSGSGSATGSGGGSATAGGGGASGDGLDPFRKKANISATQPITTIEPIPTIEPNSSLSSRVGWEGEPPSPINPGDDDPTDDGVEEPGPRDDEPTDGGVEEPDPGEAIQGEKLNEKLELGPILFRNGSAQILTRSKPEVRKLADYLERYPDVRIHITGHTLDDLPRLSRDRARAVWLKLMDHGISNWRMTFEGKSNSVRPPRGAEPRRVEITVR